MVAGRQITGVIEWLVEGDEGDEGVSDVLR